MKVSIRSKTPDMIGVISEAAGLCYGKNDRSVKRVRNCYKVGHTGILEHASVSFLVNGISRACSHQLVRHRMASYLQESQRYIKYDLSGDDWYVIPPSVETNVYASADYNDKMAADAKAYRDALAYGIKAEDARYLLPNAMKTNIVVTMNVRSLFHFFDLRLGQHAQWEIRELAKLMATEMEKVEPELMQIYYEFRDKTRID